MSNNFYVPGYTPPSGVGSREDVIRIQQQLGVKADGIWGANTQAAFDMSPLNPNGAFMSYYNAMLNSLQVPTVTVDVPSVEELEARYSSALRPSADRAISQRKSAGESAKAEMDADAAARGMDSSTFISSMRTRENADVSADIATIESAYSAGLAEQVNSALMQYEQMQMEADVFNAQQYAEAASTAMQMTYSWYSTWLAGKNSGSGGSSRSAASGASESRSSGRSGSLLGLKECRQYLSGLSVTDLKKLANSSSSYWSRRRNELEASLDELGFDFDSLISSYLGSGKGYTK